MRRSLAAAVALLWLSGCAFVQKPLVPPKSTELVVNGAAFAVTFDSVDTKSARDVGEALKVAVPRIQRWGRFRAPMKVRIHPSHDALEAAVRRFDYPWLRAWARYDSIDVQSPRTWSMLGAQPSHVVELLTHEITHCLMYQAVATESDWARKAIPLWFREGMASVTAAQGYRRPTEEELRRYLRAHPDKDPLTDGDAMQQYEQDIVYGTSHRAFEHLLARWGDDAVRALMHAMLGGLEFPAAFLQITGTSPAAFAKEYLRLVREGSGGLNQQAPPVAL
jgi:hypothetical protein